MIKIVLNLVGLNEAIASVNDWPSRFTSLFDLVVKAAVGAVESQTALVQESLVSSFGGNMPVEVDWAGFEKSEQFLALDAQDQTKIATVAASTMLEQCLTGSGTFGTTGLELCSFNEAVKHMKQCFQRIVFHVHPSSDVLENCQVSIK